MGSQRFLYCKNKFLTPTLHRMLCNAIVQLHFDYACFAWNHNLNEKLKTKIQIAQNKCIRSCLKSEKRHQISSKDFESMNWFPVYKRVHQSRMSWHLILSIMLVLIIWTRQNQVNWLVLGQDSKKIELVGWQNKNKIIWFLTSAFF